MPTTAATSNNRATEPETMSGSLTGKPEASLGSILETGRTVRFLAANTTQSTTLSVSHNGGNFP